MERSSSSSWPRLTTAIAFDHHHRGRINFSQRAIRLVLTHRKARRVHPKLTRPACTNTDSVKINNGPMCNELLMLLLYFDSVRMKSRRDNNALRKGAFFLGLILLCLEIFYAIFRRSRIRCFHPHNKESFISSILLHTWTVKCDQSQVITTCQLCIVYFLWLNIFVPKEFDFEYLLYRNVCENQSVSLQCAFWKYL